MPRAFVSPVHSIGREFSRFGKEKQSFPYVENLQKHYKITGFGHFVKLKLQKRPRRNLQLLRS